MSREKQLNQLHKLVIEGQSIQNLQGSDEWKLVLDSLLSDVENNLKEMLDSTTTSQRYYELRAEVNAIKKLLTTMDVKLIRADTAEKQKRQIESN